MAIKKITIEELARMIKNGFDQTATKEELRTLATKEELRTLATKEELRTLATKEELRTLEEKMETGFASLHANLNQMRNDHSDLPDIREELHDLDDRITRLERKTAIAK